MKTLVQNTPQEKAIKRTGYSLLGRVPGKLQAKRGQVWSKEWNARHYLAKLIRGLKRNA